MNTRLTKAVEAVANCRDQWGEDDDPEAMFDVPRAMMIELREALAEARDEAPAAPSAEALAIAELQSLLDRYPHHSAHQLRQIIAQRIAALRAQVPGSDAAGGDRG